MSTIRTMHDEHLDQVSEIEATAFGAWMGQLRGEDTELPRRTRTNVQSCRAKDTEGCFVAEEDGQAVGFIFSRTWGSVGWFGTFSVLPEYQGRGIGKALIAASLDYLRQRPGRVIGLETMPGSPYNLGLYLKLGFQVRHLTLFLSKSLEQPPEGAVHLPRWSETDPATQEGWLAELREASDRIFPGLDYSKEITATAKYRQGETLVLTDERRAVGIAVVWLTASRQGQEAAYGNTQVLALDPTYTDAASFHTLLAATESLVHAHGIEELVVPVNAQYTWALEHLLRRDYRIMQSMVRMVLKGTDQGPTTDNHVNLVRWAG